MTKLFKGLSASLLLISLLMSSISVAFAEDIEASAVDEYIQAVQQDDAAQYNVEKKTETPTANEDLIVLANDLANGTHTYYTEPSRNELTVKNKTMSLGYGLIGNTDKMYVSHLSNTKGAAYINNTMDVFVEMLNGNKYYASNSLESAKVNIYRYGYYYYENRIEGQGFISDLEITNPYSLNISTPNTKNDIENTSYSNGVFSYNTVADGNDPFFGYNLSNLSSNNYDFIEITVKVTDGTASAQLFLIAGDYTMYTADQSTSFTLINDGKYHTYQIPLSNIKGFEGDIKGVRFDISGTVSVSSIRLFKAVYRGVDTSLSIQRSFLSYSDKLHHLTQFSALNTLTGIASVGMDTKINENTVSALVVKDKSGLKYSLDGVDWSTAEYVGFDIADAGIFGYILPCDGKSGNMKVTLADGIYTITQTLPITSGQFTPSEKGDLNGNDVFFGQRIYNDETHDFAKFIVEAECERNPLTNDNIITDITEDGNDFLGYDPLYGFYEFFMYGMGFNTAYYETPNKHYNVRFTVIGDEYDRQMYFMTRVTNTGGLESAVLLDEKDMLLPVPIEVAKNFSGDGENTVYNIDDAAYSETFFPIIANAGEKRTYNLINLYQNWGRFPLKQISSIQFHTPYYHLSTGVTETNCIVPMAVSGPSLPDHRAMSAPFWKNQPQHNSGGAHSFLSYTDAEGVSNNSQNTTAVIDAYGPTYCDITMGFDSFDGKISATYTHTEMPQLDENRAFYELRYTINEDISFDDFARDFRFYRITDNNATGVYKKIGYLDVNNKCQVVDSIQTSDQRQEFVLGDTCPYFSFFYMPEWNRESTSAEGYTNLSMLIYDWEITVGGEKVDTNFFLINTYTYLSLSFDLGEVNFKKGDTISINAILMPWGSQEMDPPETDDERIQGRMYYDTVINETSGELYMDKNVRDVRENTLLNPLKATAKADCTILDSVFVPKLRTTNGKSAEFTLSGGNDNVTARIYGFDKLTVPYIEEYVNGEWIEYAVSSKETPDAKGNGHNYDGYMVHYDADGTYSYSFVTEMVNGAARTFRITAEEDFEGWPYDEGSGETDPMNVYFDANTLYSKTSTNSFFSKVELDDSENFVRYYGNGTSKEAYINLYSGKTNSPSGKYIALKYRIPTTNTSNIGTIDFWTSTMNTTAGGSDYISIKSDAIQKDGKWHVMVIDAAKLKNASATFAPSNNGTYCARYLRLDIWNTVFDTASYVDVAYIGISDRLNEILDVAYNDNMKTVSLLTSQTTYEEISTDYRTDGDLPKLTVGSVGIYNIDEFTVAINLTQNTGFSFLSVLPQYDREILSLTSITAGDIADYSIYKGQLLFVNSQNITENGTLAYLNFKIKEPERIDGCTIELQLTNANNISGEEINPEIIKGTVNVFKNIYGDTNGDSKISLLDLILLRRYLAFYDYDSGTSTTDITDGGDVNGDGLINGNDIILLRQYLVYFDYSTESSPVILGPTK